ncbi:conserved hypothetical protein [uncultured delta proteobacterium]|uniref:Radical SAM domain protein n=1 Tax=uncultured delta proteobacterium TaxID=34034 RepID=A0A212JWM4_9DELT|nr:conserved hypothetical protein [uncultured delta proteobacterium]
MPRMHSNRVIKWFEVHIAEHCNLNCVSCLHFSSLAGKEFLNLETFIHDLSHISRLDGEQLQGINLLGGEPLLHKGITDFFKAAHDIFPHIYMRCITNGILLDTMPESFWRECRDHNVTITISSYPVRLPLRSIVRKCTDFNVNLEYRQIIAKKAIAYGDQVEVGRFSKFPLDLQGSQDPVRTWNSCPMQCFQLHRGKIFQCCTAAYIEFFNKEFGTKLELTDRDYVDLRTAQSPREVSEYLSRPMDFCRYCAIEKIDNNIVWRRTKKEIEEWT